MNERLIEIAAGEAVVNASRAVGMASACINQIMGETTRLVLGKLRESAERAPDLPTLIREIREAEEAMLGELK